MQPLLSSLLIKTFHPTDKINYFIPHLAKHLRYVYITQEKATLRMNNFVCSFLSKSSSSCCQKLKHFYVCRKLFGKTKSAKNIFTRDKQSVDGEEDAGVAEQTALR